MPPLIAEELLVLAYDSDGLARGEATELDAALAGALLLELELSGAIEHRDGRLHALGGAAQPEHPQLAAALDGLRHATSIGPDQAVQRLIHGLRLRLLHDLVDSGVLADQPQRWLGVMTRHRFPELDPSVRADATRRLRALADETIEADPRTEALATTVLAAGRGDRIWSAPERVTVERRLDHSDQHRWATDAIDKAVLAELSRKMIT